MPSLLQVFTSNRMQHLAARLAEVLGAVPEKGLANPLRPQMVMVQSKGMQRWISMTVAQMNGISANIAFPFPNALLKLLYAQLIGPLPENHSYDPHVLTFRIIELLPNLLDRPGFEPLRSYLSDRRPLKQYQLARKIAEVYDQYDVYRPELLSSWEKSAALEPAGAHAAWQAPLWRELVKRADSPHRSDLQKKLIQVLKDPNGSCLMERLPDRLCVFGISYLPPFHLEVLTALAERIQVHLFILNPCRQFWFDILSDHQMIRMRAKEKAASVPVEHLHLDRGNRLLASLGHLGKHFFDCLYQFQPDQDEAFFDYPSGTLLGRIQQDILDLVDRPQGAQDTDTTPKADGTLQIHNCHSPMREIEVLHDQLLDLLNRHPELEPRDILVMTPHIGLYSPFIHAVFGGQGRSGIKLPYSVADQNISQDSKVIETFLRLLDLVERRFEASRVMMLLECDAVLRQFGLTAADLPIIEKWIRVVGIRWGWNAAERKRHHLPRFNENTWRHGLDRMILGFAMAADGMQLFSGTAPFSGIGAGEQEILGRLVSFAESVHASVKHLCVSDNLAGWYKRLNEVTAKLFKRDEQTENELQLLQNVFDKIRQAVPAGDNSQAVAFEVIRRHSADLIESTSFDSGFISGGITFCAMLPMRSIPAEVICLLGMNHDAYPREQHEPGFNLIAEEPRSGDRSKRSDDRYLFLETLISARNYLYISYIGQNIQDNAAIPPSVLVDEMIEYINEGYGIAVSEVLVRHPLQRFSPAYFDGRNRALFSYSDEDRAASEQLQAEQRAPSFFDAPLRTPRDEWKRCEWGQLASFLVHPARYLLEQRLGIYLHSEDMPVQDRENFNLDALSRYQVNQLILQGFLKRTAPDRIYKGLSASGALPHGTAGKVLFKELGKEVRSLFEVVSTLLPDETPRSEPLEVTTGAFTLCGRIDKLYSCARMIVRMGNSRPADLLGAFVFHLALKTAEAHGLPEKTIMICKDAIWQVDEVENSGKILKEWVDLYWQGLHRPLPFFNRTSFEFAHQLIVKQQPRSVALALAARKWLGNDFAAGEAEDAYLRRCFGDREALTDEFEKIALKVYAPVFDCCRRIDPERSAESFDG
jgi:exodeoxyribonuclease V gamma subunit